MFYLKPIIILLKQECGLMTNYLTNFFQKKRVKQLIINLKRGIFSMEKLLKEFELIGLIKDVTVGKISMSKMAEIINFKHLKKLTELRISLKLKE